MTNQVFVREARAQDKQAIVSFCQNTFSWGDYIADVYDQWVSDENGFALVGLVDEQPAALIHVAFLDLAVAWIEGMRVHPDFRKLGVGSIVEARARQLASERGCRVARLVTGMKNIAAQGMLAKLGYQRIAQFNEWEAEPSSEIDYHIHIANSGYLPKIQSAWNASMAFAACPLLTDSHWHWSALNESRIQQYIDAGEIRLMGHGFSILLAVEESEWNALTLHTLCGNRMTMEELARAARGEAYYRGYGRVEGQLVDHPEINAAMSSAGYRREGGLYLLEQSLK